MKMGEYIKHLRTGGNVYGKSWSQEELGHLLDPPVNRGAVNKWELGRVENLKRTHIQQLARIFGVTPAQLMCFDQTPEEEKLSKEVKVIEGIQEMFGKGAVQLLQHFYELNDFGKEQALQELSHMTELQRFTRK